MAPGGDGAGAPAFVVAAAASGTGKTTVALALMAALRRRGLSVRPFKVGPDYIDPLIHRAVCGEPSHNLDTWMMGDDGAAATFRAGTAGGGIGVVEGVMGLFDGRGGGEEGSTARLAKLLSLPVLLVVDASGASRSVAALVRGFELFDEGVDLRWVVFNRVGGARHYGLLKSAVEEHCGARAAGYLPRDASLELPSRHLGLVTPGRLDDARWRRFAEAAAAAAERTMELDELCAALEPRDSGEDRRRSEGEGKERGSAAPVVVAVARDDAFCFYYEENLRILEAAGARCVPFSPLDDGRLPEGSRGVYLGGGYPELYAARLAANRTLARELRGKAAAGMPVYAECGGLMYLGRALIDAEGRLHEMAGLMPWTSRMARRRRALGYRTVRARAGCPFLEAGGLVRGHEFRYSEIEGDLSAVERVYDVEGRAEGYLRGMVLASYVHLHFASNPGFARGFVRRCGEYGSARR
ncbi:MAG TPA: cobyrinate a,c-diamide synthase [Deltaproteobacteria bacterium]|nr:cobyrinate a,c-diamide synthase [Deltaproteobacteria bacterium]